MSVKIVIPSHKRAERVFSKFLVPDPIICVPESQADEYAEFNPECEIVTHPDSVKGLPAKRNWMVQHFRELFMIDDDVYEFQPIYAGLNETASKINDPRKIEEIINNLYRLAKALNINVFGFNRYPRPEFYNVFEPFSLSKPITGCAYGVIKSENTFWPAELKLKEDYWISCYVKYTERKLLVDNRYSFHQKDTFVNPGGLSAVRNADTEKESILWMRQYFGDAIGLKRKIAKAGNEQELNMNVRFIF